MGQQQLLLIVLGVIIVGVAIVVGINLFNANAEQAAKDTMIAEATNIGALAQQFLKKPHAMGGGEGDFTDGNGNEFAIPANLETTTTGGYEFDDGTITGTPNDSEYDWTIECTVTSTAIISSVEEGS